MHCRCGFDNLDNGEKHQLKNNIKYLGPILGEPTAHTDTMTASHTSDHYSAIPTLLQQRVVPKTHYPSMPLLQVKISFSKHFTQG